MKKKKLLLEELMLKSFVTNYSLENSLTVKGGTLDKPKPTQNVNLCLSCPSYYLSTGSEVNEHGEFIECL